MKTVNLILSGLGGQGILFMTKVLAQAALRNGMDVLGAETHGMAQRGGSVVSHLKIGSTENSLIINGSAHFLLALEENEAYRNLPFLIDGGKMFVNTASTSFPRTELRSYLENKEIVCRAMPAGQVAMDLGAPRSSNLALIGFMAAFDGSPFNALDIRETIDHISPEPFKAVNLKVFDAGVEFGGAAFGLDERPLGAG